MRSGPPSIDVAVGIVRNEAGEVLMAERRPGQMAAGFWELPGGKVDPGETPAQAAAREVLEEVGLTAGAVTPFASYAHHFPLRTLNLSFFGIERWSGTPRGREGQRWAWVNPAAPSVGPVLASNLRILRRLALPQAIVQVPASAQLPEDKLRRARAAGHTLFLLAPHTLPPAQGAALARRLTALLPGATVLIAGTEIEARHAGAAGLVSEAATLSRLPCRPALPFWGVVCHTTSDFGAALQHDPDFAITQNPEPPPTPFAVFTTATTGPRRLLPLDQAAAGPLLTPPRRHA